jgi:hypothetical protein
MRGLILLAVGVNYAQTALSPTRIGLVRLLDAKPYLAAKVDCMRRGASQLHPLWWPMPVEYSVGVRHT